MQTSIMVMILGLMLFGLILGGMIAVRSSSINADLWHAPQVPVMGPGDYPSLGGHLVQRPLATDGTVEFARLDQIIQTTARTRVLAGSVAQGHVTYVTRSLVFGFPDFTTIRLTQIAATQTSTLQIYGRLKFGKSDLGVNRARITGWLAQLDAPSAAVTPDP